MAKDQITWKRNAKATGLGAVGYDNSRRAWVLCINGMDVGQVYHTQSCASSLRFGKEEAPAWKVMFYMNKGSNLILKKQFPTLDRASDTAVAEEAKKTMQEWYPAFRVKYPDARQAPPPKEATPKTPTPKPEPPSVS